MDFLQVAIIFLIILLSVFLTITGVQVFFILKDLKKSLDRINKILKSGEEIAHDVERPVAAASTLVTGLAEGAKNLTGVEKKESKPPTTPKKRFYKKFL